MSQNEEFDRLFAEYGVLKPLVDLSFGPYAEISTMACAILRHIASFNVELLFQLDIVKRLCTALGTDIRRNRFGSDFALWIYQAVGLFAALYESITDFRAICRYSLPHSLLELTTIYSSDIGIQSAIAKALTLMMQRQDCVDVIEDAEMTPFFILLGSTASKVVALAALALANAMNLSEMVSDTIAAMAPPFGVFRICELLRTATSIELQVSLMRCLARASETRPGIDAIRLHIQVIDRFLDVEMDELDNWSSEQMLVANTIIVLKNFAIIDPATVVGIVKGRMNQLMVYAIIDYVIDMMRQLLKDDAGKDVCREVADVEEIRLILGEF
jgi:hypothetical protein